MTTVVIRDGESQDSLLRRFRKQVLKAGILRDVKRKRYYVPKSEQRRLARRKAERRERKRQMKKYRRRY